MASCFTDSHVVASPASTSIANASDSCQPGDHDEESSRNDGTTESVMDKYELDDDILEACLEKLINTTRSGECKFNPGDMPLPLLAQKIETILAMRMHKQFCSPARGADRWVTLEEEFIEALEQGNVMEAEQCHRRTQCLNKCAGTMPSPPLERGNIHRISCSPSVSQQIQDSFVSFRKDLSCDFQDWKRVLCSELRLLIQGMQMPDEPYTSLLSKAPEAGASCAPPPCHKSYDSGAAQNWKPEVVGLHGPCSEVAMHPLQSEAFGPMYTGTEVAAQHCQTEKIRQHWTSKALEARSTGGRTAQSEPTGRFSRQHQSPTSSHTQARMYQPRFSRKSNETGLSAVVPRLSRYRTAGVARPAKLFGNIETFKDEWIEGSSAYNVEQLYRTRGIVQYVARNTWFHCITLLMICASAMHMGIKNGQTDERLVHSSWCFQVPEHVFSVFFTLEILIRFGAFERKRDSLTDFWFVVDLLLVAHMLVDNYILGFLVPNDADTKTMALIRCLRLLRLARFARLLRASPEMVTMIGAMYAGTKAVASAIMMLIVLTYAFALALNTMLLDEEPLKEHFGDVPSSMWTLILQGLFMDGIGSLFAKLRAGSYTVPIGFLMLYVLLSSFVVMNMLLGIFCEVVSKVAEAEEENDARSRLRTSLLELLHRLDSDSNGALNKDEFLTLFSDPEACVTFHDHSIDADYVMDMADMLFTKAESEVPISVLIGLLLKHRAGRSCDMGDMIGAMQIQRFWTERAQKKSAKRIKQYFEDFASSRLSGDSQGESSCTIWSTIPEAFNRDEFRSQLDLSTMSCVVEA